MYCAVEQDENELSKSNLDNQQRFMKMFATDDEMHNRENTDMLPLWVPLLVSVLTGFAVGIGKSRNNFHFW